MGNVRLYGATSGYTELAPPAVAPDGVLSLPSGTGTLLTAEGGKVLQVVRATDTTNRSTTSTSFVDVTGMSVTITPQKSTSAIIILVSAVGSSSGGSTSSLTNFQITDSSNNTISGAQGMLLGAVNNTMNNQVCVSLIGYATPAALSAVTYKVRFRSESTGSTSSMRNAENTGQLYAIEVSA